MDNYDAVVDADNPLGHRRLEARETLEVDVDSGEITRAFVPDEVTFTEGGRVRPVAPFLEVWALTSEDPSGQGGLLEPLTTSLLQDEGASVRDLRWQVRVANLKVARRTGDADDRVLSDSGEFSDHARHPLIGTCENFLAGKTIGFGHVQFVKPTTEHPQIRLRFTPAAGRIYGSDRQLPPGAASPDPNISEIVYDAAKGGWDGYSDMPGDERITSPQSIYAGQANEAGRQVSSAYLDDGCDGIVEVTLDIGGRALHGLARIGAGPPTYVPDAAPIRTVADELEQALLGPTVAPADATFERVEEIVRRAFETVRLMHTPTWNVNGMGGFVGPITDASLVDTVALENLHQSLLVALRSGTAPWFADVLRDFDEAGTFTERGRSKMPAMMRGADGWLMTLTRRQIDLFRTLARAPMFSDDEQQP